MIDTSQVLYATLPRRIKASILDGVILLVLIIMFYLIVGVGTLVGRDTWLNSIAMFTPPLLLEPYLITFFGFTLG